MSTNTRAADKVGNEVTEASDAAMLHVLKVVDPRGESTFDAGSDADLIHLVQSLLKSGRADVPGRPRTRLVGSLLANPMVLQRMTRHAGFDFVLDALLRPAVKIDLPQSELNGLRALLRVCEHNRDDMRRFPTRSVGSLFQDEMHLDTLQDETLFYAMRELSAGLGPFLHSLIQHAEQLVKRGQEEDDSAGMQDAALESRTRAEKMEGTIFRLKLAAEAGLVDLLPREEREPMQARLIDSRDWLESWVKRAGTVRLSQVASPPPSALRPCPSQLKPAPRRACGLVS